MRFAIVTALGLMAGMSAAGAQQTSTPVTVTPPTQAKAPATAAAPTQAETLAQVKERLAKLEIVELSPM
ncbi:MAG TPA: hypothetical protein VMD97_01200 [Candidatus Aquilonibacter sp.]|nr:hypothetical protein [Candidatus Aquilonibacter sp.]